MEEENYYTRLKDLLKNNDKTALEMTEAINLPFTQYRSLVRYDNCPRADIAVDIAKYLNTTVEFMVTGKRVTDTGAKISSEESDLLSKFNRLSDKEKKAVIELITALIKD